MAFARPEPWEEKFRKPSEYGREVGPAALHEVLRQFNEEKSRQQMEIEKMRVDVRSQQGIVAQIAEALLGGAIEEAIDRNRRELEKQTEHVDLQGRVMGEIIAKMEEHKATATAQNAELKNLTRILDEVREDFTMETKGCITAASSKVVQDCTSALKDEAAKLRAEMAQLGEEWKRQAEQEKAAQEAELQKLRVEVATFREATVQSVEEFRQRLQEQPDPAEALRRQQGAVEACQAEVAKAQATLQQMLAAAADLDLRNMEMQGKLEAVVSCGEEQVKCCQDCAAEVAGQAEVAGRHAESVEGVAAAVSAAVTSAESQAQEAQSAAQALRDLVVSAQGHAQMAEQSKVAAQTAAEGSEGHHLAVMNALAAAEDCARVAEAQKVAGSDALAAVQSNVASVEAAARGAQEAMAAAERAAETTAGHVLAASNALSAAQQAAQNAQGAVESTETHVAAARNALSAVQSNADAVREKTSEVQNLAQQMTEQAAALRETSSAVTQAGDRAAGALASEVERHMAILQEKMRQPEVSASSPTSAESESNNSKMCMELQSQLQELRATLSTVVSPEHVEARLGELRKDLAEFVQITQVLSQKLEVVESQVTAELCQHKEEMKKLNEAPEEGNRARLEEMISMALERTEHLEQSLVAVAHPKVSQEEAQLVQVEIRELKSRLTSCELRLLEELGRVTEAMGGKPRISQAQVRSVPASLRGMIHASLPIPSDMKNRKALVIGCSYMETSSPLGGTFNDAWNVLSLLRHTLQFSENQVRFLVDGSKNCPMPSPRKPTAAVITESLQWLIQDAQSGDAIFLYFAGYGMLLPHGAGTYESCLVPIDYAALAPPQADHGSGYRLIPLTEVSQALAKLPSGCKATVVLDCCHSSLPDLGAKSQPAIFQWAQMQPAAFPGMEEELAPGFYPRARRLVLPSVPVTRPALAAVSFHCALTCYGACHQAQWCAELPIEGVMQGAFTWAWVKAMVSSPNVMQMKSTIEAHLSDLQTRHRWLDQKPVVQMSKAMEQQELGRDVTPLPEILRKPLPANPRRKALIIGINYTGSHARLKGAVNDAWNMHTMLRQCLLLEEEQIRLLVDESTSAMQVPSRANILANLQWLMEGAQPGDSLTLVFCGYGTQHPKDAEGKDYEAFLVPSDYAADLPKDWWAQVNAPAPPNVPKTVPKAPLGAAYRLISMLEINRFITQIPVGATLTTVLDCSYPALPGVSPDCNIPPTFPKVMRGRVDYEKMFDFVTRPRFLELPALPVQHTPAQIWKPQAFPNCRLHCFCAGRLQEWPSELPLEGTVQGTFTWAFAKALAAGEFRGSVSQQHQALEGITAQLKQHFQGVEQTPVLMLSQSASSSDSVFA